MQFVPEQRDLEQALRKAKPQAYDAPSGRSEEAQQIHDIFVNTPISPEYFNIHRPSNEPKKKQETPSQPPKKRDLQEQLRELNLIPNSAEGPKRGSGNYSPQNGPGFAFNNQDNLFRGRVELDNDNPHRLFNLNGPLPFKFNFSNGPPGSGSSGAFQGGSGKHITSIDENNYDEYADLNNINNNNEEEEAKDEGDDDANIED